MRWCSNSFGHYRQFAEFGEDIGGGRRPDEGPQLCAALIEVLVDCSLQTSDGAEAATPYPLVRGAEKNISTAFSQERDIGVRWKVQRGCRVS